MEVHTPTAPSCSYQVFRCMHCPSWSWQVAGQKWLLQVLVMPNCKVGLVYEYLVLGIDERK